MSKWTSWIEHEGDKCPVDGGEIIRVKRKNWDATKKERTKPAGYWASCRWFLAHHRWAPARLPRITHYKRLLSNEKAENTRERLEGLLDKIDGLESDLENAVETAFKRGAEAWCLLNYPDTYEKLVSAKTNASKLETPEKEIAPQTIVTEAGGPYETRDGRKAKVVRATPDGYSSQWCGFVGAQRCTWHNNGSVYSAIGSNPSDIIGPWVEPEAEVEEKQERWANLYRKPCDELIIGLWVERTRNDAAKNINADRCAHVGFVLLNGEEGE